MHCCIHQSIEHTIVDLLEQKKCPKLFDNYSAEINLFAYKIKKCDNAICFYIINYEISLSAESSIENNKSFQIKTFHKDVQVFANDLK